MNAIGLILLLPCFLLTGTTNAFSLSAGQLCRPPSFTSTKLHAVSKAASSSSRLCRAKELIQSLVQEDKCFSTDAGARAFGEVCATNIVYEDCYEPQPIVGRIDVTNHMLDKVAQRKGRGDVRIDKVSDGDTACGFAWTWISGNEEGLRGTTFVQLNDAGEIAYVR